MEIISLDKFESLLSPTMGLICGPGALTTDQPFTTAAIKLSNEIAQGSPTQPYPQAVDSAKGAGMDAKKIVAIVEKAFKDPKRSPTFQKVSSFPWQAVISASLDSSLETHLLKSAEKRATSELPVSIPRMPTIIPHGKAPVFKLLGSIDADNFVTDSISYRRFRNTWRHIAKAFSDRVRDQATVLIGFNDCPWALLDLVSEFMSSEKTILRDLVVVREEIPKELGNNLHELTRGCMRLSFLEATPSQTISRLSEAQKASYTQPLFVNRPKGLDRLSQHNDFCYFLNPHLSTTNSYDRMQLRDLLFQSETLDWAPFVENLDFKREVTDSFLARVRTQLRKEKRPIAHAIVGAVASGKTILAKRLANDLAKIGHNIFWYRPNYLPDATSRIVRLVDDLKALEKQSEKQPVLFIDDPFLIGIPQVNILLHQLYEKLGDKCIVILIARKSDWDSHQEQLGLQYTTLHNEMLLPEELTSDELSRLPKYVSRIGNYPDSDDARTVLKRIPSRDAGDILGVLYWLLPETQTRIQSSISDEHNRLSQVVMIPDLIKSGIASGEPIIREIYDMVAVSDVYRCPIPLEVLVSAVDGLNYPTWVGGIRKKTILWGLVYELGNERHGSFSYRPRNSIVTRTIVQKLNGGELDRSGETRLLRKIVLSCIDQTKPIYREFICKLFVNNDRFAELDYSQGMDLFCAATENVKYEDETLLHHRGKWIKDKGKEVLPAIEPLTKALAAGHFPYSERREAPEHIHNTKAAVYLKAAQKGEISLSEARGYILAELDLAKSLAFFNPNATHVQAKMIGALLRDGKETDSTDTIQLMARALSEIDHTLLILKNSNDLQIDSKDVRALEDVAAEIHECSVELSELKVLATELWDRSESQSGFVAASRKASYLASTSDRGKAYQEAYDYTISCLDMVRQNGVKPHSELIGSAISIFYRHLVSKRISNTAKRNLDWAEAERLSTELLSDRTYQRNVIYRFVLALSKAHLNLWADADYCFGEIRKLGIPKRILHAVRLQLHDQEGVRRRYQGTVTQTQAGRYLKVSELDKTFRIASSENWPEPGDETHAYVCFSFAGPLVLQEVK